MSLLWPFDRQQCEWSNYDAPDMDEAPCPRCGAVLRIGGPKNDRRWPFHCEAAAPTVSIGDTLAELARTGFYSDHGDAA